MTDVDRIHVYDEFGGDGVSGVIGIGSSIGMSLGGVDCTSLAQITTSLTQGNDDNDSATSDQESILLNHEPNQFALQQHQTTSTDYLENQSINNLILNQNEPIIIRGDGNLTIFGIFNRFNNEFPSKLNAKLAPEEYKETINKINLILKKELTHNLKWFLFGSLCCCCTFGCSLIPIIYMNKKAKLYINKLIMLENERIYKKLGLKWRLAKMKCNNNTLSEYVIRIDIMDKIQLYKPD